MESAPAFWQEVSCAVAAEQVNAISECFELVGALAVRLEAGDDAMLFRQRLDDQSLWNQTRVIALFNDSVDIDQLLPQLRAQHPWLVAMSFDCQRIENQDWVRITQEQFSPLLIADKLWICPTGQEIEDDHLLMRIDPGLAFGTGTHPTTRLCCEWLCEQDWQDQMVLDYGCGSGVLAIAALVLGAKTVYAVDHDEQALIATRSNAMLNDIDLEQQLQVMLDSDFTARPVTIIVANILVGPLLQLMPLFVQCLETAGVLVLSGLLEDQVDQIRQCYGSQFVEQQCVVSEDWVRMVWRKK